MQQRRRNARLAIGACAAGGLLASATFAQTNLDTVGVSQPAPLGATDPGYHITYGVGDWRELVPEKRVEFQSYRTIVLTNPAIDDDEKARRIAAKFIAVQKDIQSVRTAAYEGVKKLEGVGNSCTKGSSGGSAKKCDAECRGSSLPDMYTTADWARGAYKSGDETASSVILASGNAVPTAEIVAGGGALICAIALKQSSKGRKVAWSEAEFRIRPGPISAMVGRELPVIMAEVAKSPF